MSITHSTNDVQTILFDMMLGPLRWDTIELGFNTQLFDHFNDYSHIEDIAQTYGWKTEKLTLLLNSYVSIGIMEKQSNTFRLHPSYASHLDSKSPTYIGETLCQLVKLKHLPIEKAKEWLKSTEKTDSSISLFNHSFWEKSYRRLHAFHISTRNPSLLPLLCALPDWVDGIQILDMGAGSAELAKAIIQQLPSSQITLFDLPSCCDVIEKVLKQSPPNDQIRLLRGDMNKGGFKGPYHLVLAAMSLYFAEDLPSCVKELWDNVKPGGVLISFHEALNADRTKPTFHILGRLPAELSNGALSLEYGHLEKALVACHPTHLTTQHIKTPYGDMAFTVARKSTH